MDRRPLMTIFWPGWTPATDTTGWKTIPCGVWFIANVRTRVDIAHPPDNPPKDIDAVLDEAFAEHRRHGHKVVKAAPDQTEER